MAKVPSFPHSNSLQILGHGLPAVCAGVGGGSRATCGRAQASNRAATAAQQGAAEGSRAYALARRRHARRRRARARLRLRDVYSGAPCARQHLYKLRERKAPLERSARLRICEDAKSRTWRTSLARTHIHQRPSMRLRNKRAQMLRWKQARIRALCALSKQARTQHSVPTFWYRHTSKSRHSRAEKRSRFWDRFSVPKTGPFFGPDSVVIYKSIMVSKSGPVFRSHFWDRKTVLKLGPLLVSRGCVFAAHFLRAPLEILLWLATQGGRPDAHF